MPKCSGAIMLDKEMREPGKGVRQNNRGKNEPPASVVDRCPDERPAGQRANGMKDPRDRLAMGKHVTGPEVRKCLGPLHSADSTALRHGGNHKKMLPSHYPVGETVAALEALRLRVAHLLNLARDHNRAICCRVKKDEPDDARRDRLRPE
jgi:hypothetical protein